MWCGGAGTLVDIARSVTQLKSRATELLTDHAHLVASRPQGRSVTFSPAAVLDGKVNVVGSVRCNDGLSIPVRYRERKCADTVGTVLVPCMGWPFPVLKYFPNKMCGGNFIKQHSEFRKLLRFEVTKVLIAVKR